MLLGCCRIPCGAGQQAASKQPAERTRSSGQRRQAAQEGQQPRPLSIPVQHPRQRLHRHRPASWQTAACGCSAGAAQACCRRSAAALQGLRAGLPAQHHARRLGAAQGRMLRPPCASHTGSPPPQEKAGTGPHLGSVQRGILRGRGEVPAARVEDHPAAAGLPSAELPARSPSCVDRSGLLRTAVLDRPPAGLAVPGQWKFLPAPLRIQAVRQGQWASLLGCTTRGRQSAIAARAVHVRKQALPQGSAAPELQGQWPQRVRRHCQPLASACPGLDGRLGQADAGGGSCDVLCADADHGEARHGQPAAQVGLCAR